MATDKEIKQMFERKMNRLDRTSLSILVSWATNVAVATLSENEKDKWKDLSGLMVIIKSRRDAFIEMYQDWMSENVPTSAQETAQSEELEIPINDNK